MNDGRTAVRRYRRSKVLRKSFRPPSGSRHPSIVLMTVWNRPMRGARWARLDGCPRTATPAGCPMSMTANRHQAKRTMRVRQRCGLIDSVSGRSAACADQSLLHDSTDALMRLLRFSRVRAAGQMAASAPAQVPCRPASCPRRPERRSIVGMSGAGFVLDSAPRRRIRYQTSTRTVRKTSTRWRHRLSAPAGFSALEAACK